LSGRFAVGINALGAVDSMIDPAKRHLLLGRLKRHPQLSNREGGGWKPRRTTRRMAITGGRARFAFGMAQWRIYRALEFD
jgi:hypothetical protein